MLQAMPSRLVSEWMAYDKLSPIGPERDDLRAGSIAAVIANVNRDPKHRADLYQPDDFALRFGPPDEVETEEVPVDEDALPTPDELLQKVIGLNIIFGGLDLRQETPTA